MNPSEGPPCAGEHFCRLDPRISYAADSASGIVQPGRDHWPSANSLVFSGGGISERLLIGATDRRGEQAVERRLGIGDFVATVYRHLGIDAENVAIPDFSGPPDSDPPGRPPDRRAGAAELSECLRRKRILSEPFVAPFRA